MQLPNGNKAIVELVKLRDYCLNPEHPEGRHKARVFLSALGLTRTDAEELRSVLLAAAEKEEVVRIDSDVYGDRYSLDFVYRRGNRYATIRSAWIIKRGEGIPRLTSCYVL